MTSRPAWAWLLLLASTRAHAVAGTAIDQLTEPPTVEDYLTDLVGDDKSVRLFAARELRRETRRALAMSNRRNQGSLLVADALVTLEHFDEQLAPRCVRMLGEANVTVPCADILGMLETRAALPALRERLAAETRPRARRHLERAITRIEASGPGEPAP